MIGKVLDISNKPLGNEIVTYIVKMLGIQMIIKEEYFTMSDGIRLYTRMVLPEGSGKFPIVFLRTPYEPARRGEPYPAENYKDDLF